MRVKATFVARSGNRLATSSRPYLPAIDRDMHRVMVGSSVSWSARRRVQHKESHHRRPPAIPLTSESIPVKAAVADVCPTLAGEVVIGQVLHVTMPWQVEGRSLWKMRSMQLTRMWREFA